MILRSLFCTQNIYNAIKLGSVNVLREDAISGVAQFSDASRNAHVIHIFKYITSKYKIK